MNHEQTDRFITIDEIISAPVQFVWDAWTLNKGICSWLVEDSDIELSIGGKFEIYFGPDMPVGSKGSEQCTILSYDPQKMLSFSWNAPPTIPALREIGPCTWIVLHFASVDESHTKLSLRHCGIKSGSDDWDAYLAYFESAWPFVFAALQKHFA